MRNRPAVLLASLFIFAAAAVPSAAQADDPPLVNWASWLPPAGGTYEPSSGDECKSGKPNCVEKVIKAMTTRFDGLAANCDHDVMFSLTYLRTTEEYQRATNTPGFFSDPNFVNHEDAVFAGYYFRAFDDWHAGRKSSVPKSWQIALDAADKKSVTGAGDMLLGINAHINRDLPYVLEAIGLVKPDGTSRKPDHDKVNEFLNKVTDDLFPEAARRFDPTVDDASLPGWLDDMLTFQAFPAMRENAWRNAERLAAASTPLARALVEESIETSANTTAAAIVTATSTTPQANATRDTYCAAHHDDV